jgi:putative membrane protein
MGTDQHRAGGAASDQGGDGTRRTYLAWWRTGVTALAASIGVGRVVPSLTHQHRWPYAILGAGFALIGVGTIAYGLKRDRDVRAAISRGDFVQPRAEVLAVMTIAGAILGVLLLVVIVVQF